MLHPVTSSPPPSARDGSQSSPQAPPLPAGFALPCAVVGQLNLLYLALVLVLFALLMVSSLAAAYSREGQLAWLCFVLAPGTALLCAPLGLNILTLRGERLHGTLLGYALIANAGWLALTAWLFFDGHGGVVDSMVMFNLAAGPQALAFLLQMGLLLAWALGELRDGPAR
jgi:hypothetical protein